MTTQLEAMKMMVEALEYYSGLHRPETDSALAAGRTAIEAAEKVEKIGKGLQPLVNSCKETKYRRDIKTAVDRFLCWKLPKDFAPDAGISFDKQHEYESYRWPIGTNLLTAPQAKAMFEHCLEGTGYVVHPNPPSAEIEELRKLIANESYALSFQTLGQYRSALLKRIAAMQEKQP